MPNDKRGAQNASPTNRDESPADHTATDNDSSRDAESPHSNAAVEAKGCAGQGARTTESESDADNVSQVQETTLACPECDSTNLTKVHGETVAGIQPDGDGPYRCNDCGTHAEPVERPKGHTGDTRGGLAGRLANADVEDLVTDGGEPEVSQGKLEAARAAGAHDQFIAFVAEYPDSDVAETLDTAISLDALDEFQGIAGSFAGSLWEYGVQGCGNPDTENGQRIRDLFEKDQWPEWMRQKHEDGDLRADGSGHVCEACDEQFQTLTALRLHEKDDCQARATLGQIEPGAPDAGLQAAEGLLTCRECGRENPDADYDQTASYDGDDSHLIAEWTCRHCGFENENRVVMEGVSRENLADLPPHLQPDDTNLVTDGGEEIETVPVPVEAAEAALKELNRLIDEAEGDGREPLPTDRAFRARDAFQEALGRQIAGGEMSACDARSTNLRCTNAVQPAADGDAAAAECIADVAGLVNGDRDTHGDAVDQQQAAARAWSWYLKIHGVLEEGDERLQGSDVARMMGLLKISRGGVGEYDLDHDRDLVGYGGIAAACAVREGDADESELSRGGDA